MALMTSKPTKFTNFLIRYWIVGSLLTPFIRFMPRKWLVTTTVIYSKEGGFKVENKSI